MISNRQHIAPFGTATKQDLPVTAPVAGASAGVSKEWSAFAALVLLQTLLGVLYKVSQRNNAYAYSTFGALAAAETVKLAISATFLMRDARASHASFAHAAIKHCSVANVASVWALAGIYFASNQLAFYTFLVADPSSINLFKAGSGLLTAVVWCLCMGRAVSRVQGAAIVIQVCGLVVLQWDACSQQALLSPIAYATILIYVSLTCCSSVWNEMQLKGMPLSLHQQNALLYAAGAVLNTAGHMLARWRNPAAPGLLQGHNALSVAVIVVNSCFGIVITALYKYSNAIMKTIASGVTSVIIVAISTVWFGLPFNPVTGASSTAIIVSSYLYASSPPKQARTLSTAVRSKLAAVLVPLGVAVIVVALRAFGGEERH